MVNRQRTWEKLHKMVALSPDNYQKLKKIKGKSTYDETFGKIFERMEGGI
jgi:hypothetical protein